MSRSSEAPLRPDSPLPVGPLNLMTFATGGTPRAGSWQPRANFSQEELCGGFGEQEEASVGRDHRAG